MCNWFKSRVTKKDVNAVEAKVEQVYNQAKANSNALHNVLGKLSPEETPGKTAETQRALKTMRREEAQNFYGGGRT